MPSPDVLYDGAACGLLLTDRNGTIRRVNQAFCDWTGIARDQLVDKRRFQDLLTMGGRIFHQTHWEPLLQMQGSVAEVKLDLVHAEGHTIPVVMNAVSREHAGTVFRELALVIARDRHAYERELMRARRHAEQLLQRQHEVQAAFELADAQLRMALETAQLHVWEVDPATEERRYAPSVALLLGLPAPQPIDTPQYIAAIEPADRGAALAAFAHLMAARSDVYRCIYRLNGVDGVQRTVLATARTVGGNAGEAPHVIGLLQDISELSRQRKAAEDRALFAEQMIGIVSHDLRNPLSAIVLGSDWLATVDQDPRQQRMIGHISRAAGRAQRLIGDLLDFTVARIGRGLALHVKPVDLHALVAEQVDELSLAYPGRQLIHRHAGEGACMVDADRLFQLLGNLVANAMSYGAADTPVTVTSRIESSRFLLSVHNSGPAIDDELLGRLFQPMVRGAVGPGGPRGVGLGLYIVHEIARAHGGGVSVSSSVAQGTEFVACFPRGDACCGGDAPPTA